MKKSLLIAGIISIAAAIFLLGASIYATHASEKLSISYVQTIRTLIPEPEGAVLKEKYDNTMPSLSVDGIDFVGILEMPDYSSALPVCAQWERPSKYPCRLSGSIYDGSMQIGGTTQNGQYDFYRDISVGDQVYFTDMQGARYGYAVKDIRYEKHADQSALTSEDAPLTLFIKNVYGFDYILIFCDILN